MGRIDAWDELSLFGIWDELSLGTNCPLGRIVAQPFLRVPIFKTLKAEHHSLNNPTEPVGAVDRRL